MNILKVFGIVAGIHALALTLIFANPGCSSSTAKPAETAASVPAKPDPAPVISAPDTGAASAGSGSITAAPDTPPPAVGPFYAPTRPGTQAAAALESQPVSDVTPATTYTVVAGDSLWSVAKKNHLKVSELAAANTLRSGATLRLGQKLVIPSKASAGGSTAPAASPVVAHSAAGSAKPSGEGTKHVVKPGETLGTIARKYGVRVGDLAMANAISDPQKIHPGQELVIPAGGHSPGGKSSKGAPKGEAGASSAVPANSSSEAPGANQDLDAGLKPGSSTEVPVIKIENSSDASGAPASPSKQP